MNSPFKFLDSYTKADKEIFFGRGKEIEQLYQKVFESKLLLVYGVSGTGKSSLIQCGLANKFNDTDWLPINIRRGSNINDSVNQQISQALLTKMKETASLKKKINSLYLDHFKPIYLIFDQFEELFIFGTEPERLEFEQNLKKLLDSDLQCRFIFVLREEYLANVTEFEREIPGFLENRLRIEKMRATHAKEAIEGPCQYAGINLEEGFADALLEKLTNDRNEVELTWLQVFLDKLYRSAENKQKQFTINSLQQTGKVSDLLGSFLEEQIAQATQPDETLAILKSFVSVKGTKRQVTVDDVQSYCKTIGKQIDETNLTIDLQHLVSLRILRDKDENGRYELRHDALAAKIYEKITLVEKELMEVRQFVENAYENYIRRKILLNRDDLEFIDSYKSSLFLKNELNDFIKDSWKYEQSKNKTVKYITALMSVIFVVILWILYVFVFRLANENEAQGLAVQSVLRAQSIETKYARAIRAFRIKQDAISQKALFDVLFTIYNDSVNKYRIEKYFPVLPESSSGLSKLYCSTDGKYMYGCTTKNQLVIWNLSLQTKSEFNANQDSVIYIKLSPDNQYLLTVSTDSLAKIRNIKGENIMTFKTAYQPLTHKAMIDFIPSRNQVVTLADSEDFVIRTMDNKLEQRCKMHHKKVNSVDVSPDGKFIATASSDCTINVWYYNKIKRQYDWYNTLNWHRDTVWSAMFASNSQYLVSTSADSSFQLGSINGQTTQYGQINKTYFAEFSNSDRVINITHRGAIYPENYPFESYWYDFILNQQYLPGTEFVTAELEPRRIKTQFYYFSENLFKSISFCENDEFVAIIPYNSNEVWFMNLYDQMRIHDFKADHAFFIPGNKYLAIQYGNKIQLIPVNFGDIERMLSEYFPPDLN